MINFDENKISLGWENSTDIDSDRKALRFYAWQPTSEGIPQNILFWKMNEFKEFYA